MEKFLNVFKYKNIIKKVSMWKKKASTCDFVEDFLMYKILLRFAYFNHLVSNNMI